MTTETTGVVFDCMVFLQGLAKERGPAVACLELFEQGRFHLYISHALLVEVRDVLTRPELTRKFPRLTLERVDILLHTLLSKAELVVDIPEVFHYERDPKDEPYVNLAMAAKAAYLVSRDKALLDLMDERKRDGKDFRARFPTLTILDPIEFLRLISPPPGSA